MTICFRARNDKLLTTTCKQTQNIKDGEASGEVRIESNSTHTETLQSLRSFQSDIIETGSYVGIDVR